MAEGGGAEVLSIRPGKEGRTIDRLEIAGKVIGAGADRVGQLSAPPDFAVRPAIASKDLAGRLFWQKLRGELSPFSSSPPPAEIVPILLLQPFVTMKNHHLRQSGQGENTAGS